MGGQSEHFPLLFLRVALSALIWLTCVPHRRLGNLTIVASPSLLLLSGSGVLQVKKLSRLVPRVVVRRRNSMWSQGASQEAIQLMQASAYWQLPQQQMCPRLLHATRAVLQPSAVDN